MKNILISNIGNRNIKYHKFDLTDYIKEFKIGKSFKELTKEIWIEIQQNNLERLNEIDKEELVLAIIPNYIVKDKNYNIGHIYLFTTNQNNDKQGLDTVYEGYIVKFLLEKFHPQISVELIEYKENPTLEDKVIQFAAPELKRIRNAHPTAKAYYNDAGGVPGMKNVIKMLTGYYMPDPSGEPLILYVDQQDKVYDVNRSFHLKYSLLQLAQAFVKRYDYESALFIIKQIPSSSGISENLSKYLYLSKSRMLFARKEIEESWSFKNKPLPMIRESKYWQAYIEKKIHVSIVNFPDYSTNKSRSEIFELASICQLYFFELKNYTFGIVTYYRLCEEIGQQFVELRERKTFAKSSDYFEVIKPDMPGIKTTFSKLKDLYGVPLLIAYMHKSGSESLKKLTKLLIPTLSHINGRDVGLNTLRNHSFLAHDNQSITRSAIEKECPNFFNELLPQIFQTLGLPEVNVYSQMNQEIEQLFMQE